MIVPSLADLLAAARQRLNRARLTPDGFYYLAAARGEPTPRPYAYRWLLPALLGPETWRWVACTYASLLALPVVAWFFFATFGLEDWPHAFAMALLVMLQGVTRTSIRYPVLTDAPAFVLALAAATVARHADRGAVAVLLAVVLALLAGAAKEESPLFAALWAWSPWPLLGLLGVGWWAKHLDPAATAEDGARGYRIPPPTPLPVWLVHPVQTALALRRRAGLDGALYVRPWGAAVAGLALPTWQLGLTLLVAYGQLLAAQDSIRLYQWAAPVLVAHAAHVLPIEGWPACGLVALALTITRDDRV